MILPKRLPQFLEGAFLCIHGFGAATDATISEYANFLRIRKAYDLIRYTDQKLSEIAASCAFSSIHYFSRVFRRYVGMSPSQVRDRDRSTLDTDIRLHGQFQYRYYSSLGQFAPDGKINELAKQGSHSPN